MVRQSNCSRTTFLSHNLDVSPHKEPVSILTKWENHFSSLENGTGENNSAFKISLMDCEEVYTHVPFLEFLCVKIEPSPLLMLSYIAKMGEWMKKPLALHFVKEKTVCFFKKIKRHLIKNYVPGNPERRFPGAFSPLCHVKYVLLCSAYFTIFNTLNVPLIYCSSFLWCAISNRAHTHINFSDITAW